MPFESKNEEEDGNLKTSWNILDKIIAKFRYVEVDKYVLENTVIVDIGCGQEGSFLIRHKDKITKGYGFDFKIKNHDVDNITFINNAALNKFPLENNSVDTIFMNALLEHLDSPEELLLNALAILKNDGKLIMTTPTPISKPILEFMAYKLHIINEMEIREHKHYYSRQDIENLVNNLNRHYSVKLCKYKKFELGVNSLIVIKKEK